MLENKSEYLEYEYEKALRDIYRIKIRINPAGFILVRNILPSFEFYSNITRSFCDREKCKNHEPLFFDDLKKVKKEFKFERKIKNVIFFVRNHIKMMDAFYKEYYEDKEDFDINKFYVSKYCFRYFGQGNTKSSKGYFHSTRIITHHLGEISDFRLYITKNISGDLLREVNEKITNLALSYVNLLDNGIDEAAKIAFSEKFKTNIEIIRKNLNDKTTKIN